MKTLLFDFDGTLVNSMPVVWEGFYGLLDEYHVVYPDNIVNLVTALSYPGIANAFIGFGLPLSEEAVLARMHKNVIEAYKNKIPAKNNVISALQQLKSDGYDLNILSGSPHAMIDPCLERLGIRELFSNVWSCDDFNTVKTNPEIYKMAAKGLQMAPGEVLFFDDNYHSIETAKRAGMLACGVYDEFSSEYADSVKELADYYITDFSELPDFLSGSAI